MITVPVVDAKPFGEVLKLDVPPDANLIIVLTNEGRGWVAHRVLLPHQLYREDVEAMLAALKGYAPWCEVAVVPIKSSDITVVARQS